MLLDRQVNVSEAEVAQSMSGGQGGPGGPLVPLTAEAIKEMTCDDIYRREAAWLHGHVRSIGLSRGCVALHVCAAAGQNALT